MTDYCNIQINAPTMDEASKIVDVLLEKKLMAGASIFEAPSKYWWNDEIVERTYYHIHGFSLMKKKDEIIRAVEIVHSDECPVIVFTKIDGNTDFLKWIEEYVK